MTMLDMKCDVCNVGEAVGVASTLMPYSCAYCVECLRRGAQPEIVFLNWHDASNGDLGKLNPEVVDQIVTYHEGQYKTYREWHSALPHEGATQCRTIEPKKGVD